MTDFIDSIFQYSSLEQYQSEASNIYQKYLFEKSIHYKKWGSSQTSISDTLHEEQQIECYQRYIPFRSNQYWNYKLLLLIKHSSHQVSTEVKILSPKGDILKVVSQYHRTFLYRRFLQKNNSIIGKINPESGQIALCTSFTYQTLKDTQTLQKIAQNLLNSVLENQELILQIINLVQNKQQSIGLVSNKQNTTNIPAFIRLCSKKSNKENKVPFHEEQYFQKRKEAKSRTYGGEDQSASKPNRSKAQQMTKYLNNPLQTIDQIWQYDNMNIHCMSFRREVKNILGNVENSLMRKDTPLKNYQMLKLQPKHYEHLVSSIVSMKQQRKSKEVTKIQKMGFGKVTVQIQIQRYSSVQKTYKFLSSLPTQIQLSFINNYFSCNDLLQREESKDVIIQLAIRRQQLLNYLQSNSQCISFSTKLRILSQLISSTHLLQNKCSTLMTNVGMKNFSIAKNMMVKINDLEYLKRLTEDQKKEFQQQIKMGFVENQVNISRIYSKLFYKNDPLYLKPSKNANKVRLSHVLNSKFQEKQVVVDKIYEECGFYGPKKLMALLTCIFIPYIPMVSFEQIKKDPPCKNLKYGIASLIKILENID